MSDLRKEFNIKKNRLSKYLDEKGLEGVILAKKSNYAWLICGARNKVVDYSEIGEAILLFWNDKLYLFTSNIEIERMKNEETNNFGFIEFVEYRWFEKKDLPNRISNIADLTKIKQDHPIIDNVKLLEEDFNNIKFQLVRNEKERYKEIGKLSSKCVTNVCKDIKKGISEFEVQAMISNCLISKGLSPTIILVGSDERLFNYRHPIPTSKKVEKYLMIVVGAMKWGLITAITRLVHFGKPSREVMAARDIILKIDAEMILGSRPGIKYCDILKKEIESFNLSGLKNEWFNHHQGGPIGYEGRYFLTDLKNQKRIEVDHAIAWNPSMRGYKSEDTIIVEKDKNLVITQDDDWPLIKVKTKFGEILRPGIFIV